MSANAQRPPRRAWLEKILNPEPETRPVAASPRVSPTVGPAPIPVYGAAHARAPEHIAAPEQYKRKRGRPRKYPLPELATPLPQPNVYPFVPRQQ